MAQGQGLGSETVGVAGTLVLGIVIVAVIFQFNQNGAAIPAGAFSAFNNSVNNMFTPSTSSGAGVAGTSGTTGNLGAVFV